MQQRFRYAIRTAMLALLAVLSTGCAQMGPAHATLDRLYVIDCGKALIPDLSPWSPGFNVGKAAVFSDNCYLLVHGKDLMLWDSGYTDALASLPGGQPGPRLTAVRETTLAAQLDELGVRPEQISRIAFSHGHQDHMGNANLFPTATVYMQQAEFDAAFGPDPAKFGFTPELYNRLRADAVVRLHGDFDVFGDGSVTILSTPGHTPGHQSLLVRLPKTGAVVLSGDAAHFGENFALRRVPSFNFDKDASVRSMDKLARIVEAEHAQLWINHDSAQSATLPHAPRSIE
ncbi:MAG TPA: N-acyl homoserine lactonase family protein [Caldimonas sp.]|jgi:glyoxylase-like metal-dependent hydrolase (beta-lactamase superfamily II)